MKEVVYNPSYEQLYKEEMDPALEGFEVGVESEFGAVSVDTGIFTGRSPKDKYIVKDETTRDTVWWKSDTAKSSDNKAIIKGGLEAWLRSGNKPAFGEEAFCDGWLLRGQ